MCSVFAVFFLLRSLPRQAIFKMKLEGCKGHTQKGQREEHDFSVCFPYALCGYALCTLSS